MLIFKKLDDNSCCELCGYYKFSPYFLSDYSIGLKRMWSSVLNPEFALSNGCLIVKNSINGMVNFDCPMPFDSDEGFFDALNDISEYCRSNYIPMKIINIPEERLSDIISVFPRCEITYDRKYSDYVYLTAKLSEMSGRAYSAQRNHIKKFLAKYPDAQFKAFGADDVVSVKKFLKRFSDLFSKASESAIDELNYAETMLERIGNSCFRCGGYVLDGEIISLCFCEKCGNTLIDHIEKALYEFEGIYPATVQAFLQRFGQDAKFFNREDDSGDKGLRTSKLQYKPFKIAHKYSASVNNELASLNERPILKSERLTFSEICPSDIDEYNRLCLDIQSNKYWGYDYRNDSQFPDRTYFFDDQNKDFCNRLSMCLAVRLGNIMIGEVIIHNFDCQGNAEIGIRLLNEYKGNGYGRETLNTVIRYALYELGLDSVHARCYKENRTSSNMLSTVMRFDRADEVYEYYISTF